MKERYEHPASEICLLRPESGFLMASNEDLPVVPVTPFYLDSASDDDPWFE